MEGGEIMSEVNKIIAAQLTNALLVSNTNLNGEDFGVAFSNIDSVIDTYNKFLSYLNSVE